ncbi:MAG: L,D-transpeptidase family protein [Pseudomonadota bacterium]
MSTLVFDGEAHQIALVGKDGKTIAHWIAYNNVDRHATLTHVRNGTYMVLDRNAPRRHQAKANGPYGLHGIIRFNVPGHPGIGVHSGRANARSEPGPTHATMGCIRTTDAAMEAIVTLMKTDPLDTIDVTNHSAGVARHAAVRNHFRTLHDPCRI